MIPTNYDEMEECALCPRSCHADRAAHRSGYCRLGDELAISSICAHRGEEPVISGPHGVCNVFFAHCNLQCCYCQNHQISSNRGFPPTMTVGEAVSRIETILDHGACGVGFVSPSHSLVAMMNIIRELKRRGRQPTFVFNTNSYDRPEVLASLADTVDVYLPDLKYMNRDLGRTLSDVADYPSVAGAALREMFCQKGADITLDESGYIVSGMIIRHLVLPGQVENSKAVLRFIARELSPDIHISLMSQYHPTAAVRDHPDLGRVLKQEEYEDVLGEFDNLGFHRGWVQELESARNYLPDFEKEHPFED